MMPSGNAVYIFLDPDGTQEHAVYVLVLHPTGVRYAHQCAGNSNDLRVAEGFLIPLGGPTVARPLTTWFVRTFRGNSYDPATTWGEARLAELRALVKNTVCWYTDANDIDDRREHLRLDEACLGECTEGWVPVETPYGNGILIFPNCD